MLWEAAVRRCFQNRPLTLFKKLTWKTSQLNGFCMSETLTWHRLKPCYQNKLLLKFFTLCWRFVIQYDYSNNIIVDPRLRELLQTNYSFTFELWYCNNFGAAENILQMMAYYIHVLKKTENNLQDFVYVYIAKNPSIAQVNKIFMFAVIIIPKFLDIFSVFSELLEVGWNFWKMFKVQLV